MINNSPIPIIMYHSIGIPNKNWIWNHLTCPFGIFEEQLKYLKRFGYCTISLKDLYNYIFNNCKVPIKSIVLTFDDGYLDNWVYAFPLLKKYNMQGTIFINPDFVDKRGIKRKRLDQINDIDEIGSLDTIGFLSWDEIVEMQQSGNIDIQSHAMTHTWYPISDEIIDFRHPNDKYIWMTWNQYPEKKPFLHLDNVQLVNFGEPVYKHEKSLSSRRFYPDIKLTRLLTEYVKMNGNSDFFKFNIAKDVLREQVALFKSQNDIDQFYETEADYNKRIEYELAESKKQIEDRLSKKIEFLCWPGGSSTTIGHDIALNLGYLMTTAGRDVAAIRDTIKNCPPQSLTRFRRINPFLFWNGIEGLNSKISYYKGSMFIMNIFSFRSGKYIKFLQRLLNKMVRVFIHFTR